eukprot:CAMPEP_0197546952 /NCGR_PEP_ID=MMETSP1320-20131121/1425_1 /TAXON_ID=91990 /ORGANISM="Bolidomonas sp., Strain RCC2347" /LENGTH=76 /DNA_ID=CAMNT_0043106625 /DNA_START=281 /DNA_END=511 /DNA_ORIENTATION=-
MKSGPIKTGPLQGREAPPGGVGKPDEVRGEGHVDGRIAVPGALYRHLLEIALVVRPAAERPPPAVDPKRSVEHAEH